MAQAAKLNNEETRSGSAPFEVPGQISKIAEYPRRLRQFLHEVRVEMKAVNWPSRTDVWSTTIVVTVTVAFFAAFFFVTDWFLSKAENWLLHVLKH
jgi:preprotein translocase subunit SecE